METKELLRETYKKIRRQVIQTRGQYANGEIFSNFTLLPEYEDAQLVFFYCSYGSEADTGRLMEDALFRGKNVAVPVSRPGGLMDFYEIESTSDLKEGFCGIPEPDMAKRGSICTKTPDLIIIPGLAFDKKGHRLGYGGGYYDRLLEKNRDSIRIAIAFEEQLTDEIPALEHDEGIDILVTDLAVRRF